MKRHSRYNVLKPMEESGAICVGMESRWIDRESLAEGDFKTIAQKVKDVLKIIQELKHV